MLTGPHSLPRGLTNEKRYDGPGPDGRVRSTYLNFFVKIKWLYSMDNFNELPKSHSHARWKSTLPSLGKKERVETDHTEWIRLARVLPDKGELDLLGSSWTPAWLI